MSIDARRKLGILAWGALALTTLVWLITVNRTFPVLAWLAVLLPFAALAPGLLRYRRNSWLLALLATIGYAVIGLMDVIANAQILWPSATLAMTSLAVFFMLIPAIRTIAPEPSEELPG